MATLLSDKVEFRAKKMNRDQDGHYVIIKLSNHQEDVAILNVYHKTTELQNI